MDMRRPYLSIIIKTLNEQQKIDAAIKSALAISDEIQQDVEVVVADSVSNDATVDIACRYPIRVVQFANPAERGCGAGVQLGFQHAQSEYVYFLDGDMIIVPGFMPHALAELARNPRLAGVGGFVEDTRVHNDIDRIRVNNRVVSIVGMAKWLEGGGLYRRCAIEEAGCYAADRNLKGYEEAELGMRLRHAGWHLMRLPLTAVIHTGHALGTLELLRRHWRSRRAMSGGMLLRGAVGRPWLLDVLRLLVHPLATLAWWLGFALLPFLVDGEWRGLLLAVWATGLVLALIALQLRKRDWRHAMVSFFSWHYGAAAILLGLLERRVSPTQPVAARLVCDHVPAGFRGSA